MSVLIIVNGYNAFTVRTKTVTGNVFAIGGVKFSMKTLQHVGHARAKRAFNGVALKKDSEGI